MSGQPIIRRVNRRLTPIVLVLLTLLGAELVVAASASARRPGGGPTTSRQFTGHIPTVPVTVTGLDH